MVGGSAHAATLEQWRAVDPNLSWVENPLAETEELLYRLSRREFDYTVADSNEFAIGRAFHPEIRIAFDRDNLYIGALLGYLLDMWWGTDLWLVVTGIVLGSYSGFLKLWKYMKEQDKPVDR